MNRSGWYWFSISTLVLPAIGMGRHETCLPSAYPESLLRCAFGIDLRTLQPPTAGLPYQSQTDTPGDVYPTDLYPAANDMPAGHRADGEAIAAGIVPLDPQGRSDSLNGEIVVVVKGFSHTKLETIAFIDSFLTGDRAVNSKFQLIDRSLPGCNLLCWSEKGVGEGDPQVLIVLMKHNNSTSQRSDGTPRAPNRIFPNANSKRLLNHAPITKAVLKTRIRDLKIRYPNLKMIFLTNRIYGNWSCGPTEYSYREPVAFEEGFAVKWLIEDQILRRDPECEFKVPKAGAPWLAWEPATDNSGLVSSFIIRDVQILSQTAVVAYGDIGLHVAAEHSYRVVAVNAAGNASAGSDPAVDHLAWDGRDDRAHAVANATNVCRLRG